MANTHVDSPSLFPSKESSSGFLSDNTIRQIKKVVEDDIDVEFELRQCRRTFGQRNLDRGLEIESASVLMGHATTNTTERFYSRIKLGEGTEEPQVGMGSTAVNGEHAQEEEF